MHTKFERLLSKSLTTLEVMTYYLVVHTGLGWVLKCGALVRGIVNAVKLNILCTKRNAYFYVFNFM